MPTFYPSISSNLADWALNQPLFFTASAPLAGRHVNISPKGHPRSTFRILDENHAAYIDATGSGSETISHAYEPGNGRVTIMFCSFGASPRIMRFFCNASVVEWDQGSRWDDAVKRFGMTKEQVETVGARAIVFLDVWKVQTSCGFGVPIMSPDSKSSTASSSPPSNATSITITNAPPSSSSLPPTSPSSASIPSSTFPDAKTATGTTTTAADPFTDRPTMTHWAANKIKKNQLHSYQRDWNAASLDGLPGMRRARRDKGEKFLVVGDVQAWLRRVFGGQKDAVMAGVVLGWIVLGLAVLVARVLGFERPLVNF